MGTFSPPTAFTRWLRELPNFVVLRNEENLFENLQRGGDIDLLVADLELAEQTLIRHLGPPVRMIRSSYVRGYSYDWGHVDLLPTIEWRGASFVSREALLEGRRLSARGLPAPRIAHEAVISWLTSLLFGGFFKERYAGDIRQAVATDGAAFQQTLIEAAGQKWGERLWQAAVNEHPEISAEWTRPLRRAVWGRACVKSPARTIQRCVAFVIAELRLRWKPSVPWIAILGSDVSRTSSLTNEIVQRFAACPYATVKAFQWRPPITSRLKPLVLAADWAVAYWSRLVHLRAKGYILAFDGMYVDLVVDPKRSRDARGRRLASALWWLLPKPDVVFVFNSESDVLRQRPPDAPPSEPSGQRRADGASIRKRPAVRVLNGCLPPSALADEVQRVIRAWMLDRSVTGLGGVTAAPMTAATASGEDSNGAPALLIHDDGAR